MYTLGKVNVYQPWVEYGCLILIWQKFQTMFVAASKNTSPSYFFLNKKMTKMIIFESIKFWPSGFYKCTCNYCPGCASLANLKRYSFCLFVVVSLSLWWRVGWELPGYFKLVFHICVTRFSNSVTHEISLTIRFILCDTIMACFLLGRLFNSLTAGIVLVGQFWYVGSC